MFQSLFLFSHSILSLMGLVGVSVGCQHLRFVQILGMIFLQHLNPIAAYHGLRHLHMRHHVSCKHSLHKKTR